MKNRLILLCVSLFFLAACLTTGTPGSDAVNTEVARQLTVRAAVSQSGGTPPGPAQTPGSSSGELPTVTQTGIPPASATPTITPTITATPSFTPPADDPALTLGTPSYRTDFPDATNWWPNEDDNAKFEVVDHKMVMTAKLANSHDWYTRTGWDLTNYYLEMTGTTDTCAGRDRYGLVTGIPYPAVNLSFWFKVSCDGYYGFFYQDTNIDYSFRTIKDWSSSSYIYTGSGQTNRIGFKAEGTHISLYVNGYFLTDWDEPMFGTGRFGIFVGAVKTPNFTVRVSEVAYWVLP